MKYRIIAVIEADAGLTENRVTEILALPDDITNIFDVHIEEETED